jgi:hypothetical protein
VTNEASVLTGSKLVDNSKIYHSDANYNFKDLIEFAEIQVGGSYRQYALNSLVVFIRMLMDQFVIMNMEPTHS